MFLRELGVFDLPDCEKIARQIYYPHLWEPIEAFQKRIDLYPQGNYVAAEDVYTTYPSEKVLGYLYSHPWRHDKIVNLGEVIDFPEDLDCYYVHDIAVDPQYRKTGVGTFLMEKAIEIATFDLIKLVAVLDSQDFWKRFGFKIIEPIVYAPGVNAFVMERRK
jgi:ribosomal protein S18 acetylase RimI-like enzyme